MSTHRYVVLDGLRGVAAILVLLHHIEGYSAEPARFFYNGFLAVDLFFILSGFVIAFSYDRRFANGMGFSAFAALRLIRLWPLAAAGAVLGAIAEVGFSGLGGAVLPLIKQLLFVPSFSAPNIYPYNAIQWTLFFELFVNATYALGFWRLGNRALAVVIGLSLCALIASGFYYGTIGNGFNPDNFLGGFPRVFFGFFVGVALYRISLMRASAVVRVPSWLVLVLYVVVCLGFSLLLKHTWKVDLILCVLVLPAIVYVAAAAKPATWEVGTFYILGELSYPIYALQGPIRHYMIEKWDVSDGIDAYLITLSAVTLIGYIALKLFDEPLRRFLRAMSAPKKPQSASAS